MSLALGFLLLSADLLLWGNLERVIEASLRPEDEARKTALRIGANPWPGYEPLYVAREQRLWDPKKVALVEYPSATLNIKALKNGVIDAAALTFDEVLQLREMGTEVKVVVICDYSRGADAILARPEYPDLKSLQGRPLGFENTALGGFFFARALDLEGLSKAEFQLVPLQIDAHVQAYKSGRVDAVVTFEPSLSRLRELGARIVFDSSRIPGEIIDVLAVREDYINRHPQKVQELVDGWFRGLEFLQSRPKEGQQALAERHGMSLRDARRSLEGMYIPSREENLKTLSGHPSPFEGRAQRLYDYMRHNNLLKRSVDLARLPEPRFVQP